MTIANDTLKKQSRYIIGFSISNNDFLENGHIYEKGTKPNYIKYYISDRYILRPKLNLNLNFNYLLTRKSTTVNQLYFGLGLNYLSANLTHQIYGFSEGRVSGTYSSFSQDEFKHQVTTLSIVPHINYLSMFKHFVIINKFGAFVSFLRSKNTYNYDEYIYSYDDYNHTNTLISTTTKKEKINESALSLFYNTGFGFRIKHIMPFINTEITWLSKTFNQPFIKYQLGISYLF